MSVTDAMLQEYVTRVGEKKATDRAQIFTEQLLKQAAVQSDLLTGHPAWDTFLTRLQAMHDDLDTGKAMWQDRLNGAFDERSRTLAQVELHRHLASLEMLDKIMALPKEITDAAAAR